MATDTGLQPGRRQAMWADNTQTLGDIAMSSSVPTVNAGPRRGNSGSDELHLLTVDFVINLV